MFLTKPHHIAIISSSYDQAMEFYVNKLGFTLTRNVCRPEQNKLLCQSLRKLCPNLNVQLAELPGKHTFGSEHRNEKGTFDFNDTVLAFLDSLD